MHSQLRAGPRIKRPLTRRATTATYFDRNGVLQEAAPGECRPLYDAAGNFIGLLKEPAATNYDTNPRCEGATTGTGWSYPSGWTGFTGPTNGVTAQIVGTGTENGIPYVDWHIYGTNSGTGTIYCQVNWNAHLAATPGDVLTESAFLKLIAGSPTPGANILLQQRTATDAFIANSAADVTPTGAALGTYRPSVTSPPLDPTVSYVVCAFATHFDAGVSGDMTIRIGAPQVEDGSIPTSVIFPPVGSPAATARAAD